MGVADILEAARGEKSAQGKVSGGGEARAADDVAAMMEAARKPKTGTATLATPPTAPPPVEPEREPDATPPSAPAQMSAEELPTDVEGIIAFCRKCDGG